jgi:hypothetical protein
MEKQAKQQISLNQQAGSADFQRTTLRYEELE